MYAPILLAAIMLSPALACAADLPPNILFILCDDLGINDLGCYGRRDHRTPNLDRLAAQGTRFTSAYCCAADLFALAGGDPDGQAPARLHLTTYLPGPA